MDSQIPTTPLSQQTVPTDVPAASTAAVPTDPVQQDMPMAKGSKNLKRGLIFGGLVVFAAASVALATLLPKKSTEDRSQASVTGACIGQVTSVASACNEKCMATADCMTGMTCYVATGSTEGVCRNATNPTSTTCSALESATPPVTVKPSSSPLVCKQACTFNYECNLANKETCVGTNVNNPNPGIVPNPARAATAAELATLAPDQIISMTTGNQYKPDGNGVMTFSVISKQATTFTINVFDITAQKGQLDPQTLVMTKSYPIGANQVVTGTITLPRCGRYQVDFGSPIVAGTKYDANSAAHYFWGTVFEIPCQSGCCRPASGAVILNGGVQTLSAPASTSSESLIRLSLVDPVTGISLPGYTALGDTVTITKATMPVFTIAAVSFPNVFPTGAGSVKFEVNGAQVRVDNLESFQVYDAAANLPVGTYTIKATLYSLDNAAGSVVGTLNTTLIVK